MTVCDFKEQPRENNQTIDLPEGIPPLRAFYLYLSNSCNLACRHCWITPRFVDGRPDPGEVIDVADLMAAIAEAKPMGLGSIKLTGGEPMLHPCFGEIVDKISQEELGMNMETNATLLTAETARYLKNETTMGFVSVSIDSSRADHHDRFRGVKGAFDQALRGLDNLVAAGYDNVQVIMSVHRGNRDEIEDLVRLAANHGAASVKFNPVMNNGRGTAMTQRGETLDFSGHLALNDYIYKELTPAFKDEGVAVDLILCTPPALTPISEMMRRGGRTGDCGVLGILGILGSGDIALCGIGRQIPELVYGRLGRDAIRDLWLYHPTILKLRKAMEDVENYPGICGECKLAKHCRTGCVAQNYVDGNKLVWPDQLCETALRQDLFPVTRRKTRPVTDNVAQTRFQG